MCQKKPHGLSQEVRELIMIRNVKRWKFVPRQGVEPCFAQDKEMHARKMGKSRTRARVGKSVACRRDRRGRKTRRASRRTAQTFKIIQLQSDEKDVRPCVFRCKRLHGCCKSQPTGGLPRTSDTDKYLRWWVFVADFARRQPTAELLASVKTIPSYSP